MTEPQHLPPPATSPLERNPLLRLLDGAVREFEALRTTTSTVRQRKRIALARQRARAAMKSASTAAERHRDAHKRLAATSPVSWPMNPAEATAITVLLALAGYFTINATLAAADLSPLEAYLLPVAFGPVFVLATKIAVSVWLSTADNEQRSRRALTARLVAPSLLAAMAGLVIGLALKAAAVGSFEPLSASAAHLSSMLMFASLMLGEFTGAAALAAKQHAPGARDWSTARAEERRRSNEADHAQRKARQAIGLHDGLQEQLLTSLQAQDDRGKLTKAWAWLNAAKHARDGDRFLTLFTADHHHLNRPDEASRKVADPTPVDVGYRAQPTDGNVETLEEEFDRMMKDHGHNQDHGQNPNQDQLW